jgi:hypothetical protein
VGNSAVSPPVDGKPPRNILLGLYRLEPAGSTSRVRGQSAKKVDDLYGTATEYAVTAEDGTDLLLRDTRWDNGQRDVRAVERFGTPPPYDTVLGRLRISVDAIEDELFMELRQARLKSGGRAQVASATLEELDEGAGVSVRSALRNLGASVGTKELLLSRRDQTRDRLCCRFPESALFVPPAVFVLTRIAPVGRGYRWRYSS